MFKGSLGRRGLITVFGKTDLKKKENGYPLSSIPKGTENKYLEGPWLQIEKLNIGFSRKPQ